MAGGTSIRQAGKELKEFTRREHRGVHTEVQELRRTLRQVRDERLEDKRKMEELIHRLTFERWEQLNPLSGGVPTCQPVKLTICKIIFFNLKKLRVIFCFTLKTRGKFVFTLACAD